MKILSIKSILILLAIATVTFVSCSKSKDDTTPKPATMEGSWVGKWGDGANQPVEYFAVTLHNDGTLDLKEGSAVTPSLGVGAWTVTDGNFHAVYHYLNDPTFNYNLAGIVNAGKTKITGNWGYGETVANIGTFYFDKQ